MDILEHLGMKEPDIEGHGVIIGRATGACSFIRLMVTSLMTSLMTIVIAILMTSDDRNAAYLCRHHDSSSARHNY